MKTILVPMGGSAGDEAVLATALAAARPFGAHLDLYHLRIGPAEAALATHHVDFARGPALTDALAKLKAADADRSRYAHRRFEAFCAAHRLYERPQDAGAVSASWREEAGDALQRLILAARRHDLTVLGRPHGASGLPQDFIELLLLEAGRPLLIAPSHPSADVTGTIVVCWKECAEAARAVAAAMPLLERARQVVITTVAEGDETSEGIAALVEQLRWHGIAAEGELIVAADGSPVAALQAMAKRCRAGLLVSGGYGRSRVREIVFGGVTQAFLDECDVPVLLAH